MTLADTYSAKDYLDTGELDLGPSTTFSVHFLLEFLLKNLFIFSVFLVTVAGGSPSI